MYEYKPTIAGGGQGRGRGRWEGGGGLAKSHK